MKMIQVRLRKSREPVANVTFAGLPISIELRAGDTRTWTDPDGTPRSISMVYDYGEIRGSLGTDGDAVDVYLGPYPDSERVFIVNQRRAPDFTQFDEQKVMLGFRTPIEAKDSYCSQYDPRFYGSMIAMRLSDFKKRLEGNKGIAIVGGKMMFMPPVTLIKASGTKPPPGYQAVMGSKKGGYKKMVGGKWEYWYPGQPWPKHSSGGKSESKKTAKPSPTRVDAVGAKPGEHLPSVKGSRAEPGTGAWAMDNGVFQWMKSRHFTQSEDNHQMRRTELVPNVDEATKNALLSEFRPLLIAEAKATQRKHALKTRLATSTSGRSTDQVREELISAGTEGLLSAIQLFKADATFASYAQVAVKDAMRREAVSQRLGMSLPIRHERNLTRYIRARQRAAAHLQKDNPTPEDTLPFFDLRKKHIHGGLPAKNDEGDVRNAQIPDREGYKLTGGRNNIDGEATRDVVEQRSKLDWARMYDGLLHGEKSVEAFDEEKVFGAGGGVGYGFSPEEQVSIRQEVTKAMKVLDSMNKAKTITFQLPGTKNPAKFRVDSVAGILARRLGIGSEEQSVRDIAEEVPVYKVGDDGKEKPVGNTSARLLIQSFVEEGMKDLQRVTRGDATATSVIKRAAAVVAPATTLPAGPTYAQTLQKAAASLSEGSVKAYTEKAVARHTEHAAKLRARAERVGSPKLKEHLITQAEAATRRAKATAAMSDEHMRMEAAKEATASKGMSAKMRAFATRTAIVERIDEHNGIIFTRDEDDRPVGIKVKMGYDPDAKLAKAEYTGFGSAMALQAVLRPATTMWMTEPNHAPSPERAAAQDMLGWYQ